MIDGEPERLPQGWICLPKESLDRLVQEVARIADSLEEIRRIGQCLPPDSAYHTAAAAEPQPFQWPASSQPGRSINEELDANDLPPRNGGFFHAHLKADPGFNFREEYRQVCRAFKDAANLERGLTGLLRLGWQRGRPESVVRVKDGLTGIIRLLDGLRPEKVELPLLLLPPGGGQEYAVWIEATNSDSTSPWKAVGLQADHLAPTLKYVAVDLAQD